MFRRLVSLGAAALAGLTAACDEAPTTVPGTWRSPAAWSSMVYATSDGPLLVEVRGRPFATSDGFADIVAQAMSGQVQGRALRFTAEREAAPRPQFRVVVAFNPPENLDVGKLCAGQIPTAPEPRERLFLLAAFCQDDTLLSSTRGWVNADGAADARFRHLLGQVARDLFPGPG